MLVPSIVPYTLVVMKPTNDKLNAKVDSLATTSLEDTAAEAGVAKEETAHGLLDKCTCMIKYTIHEVLTCALGITLNLGRSLLPLVGTICAAWASVDKYEVLGLADITFRSGANRLG